MYFPSTTFRERYGVGDLISIRLLKDGVTEKVRSYVDSLFQCPIPLGGVQSIPTKFFFENLSERRGQGNFLIGFY